MHLVGGGTALQEEAEPVAGPLVVLQPLAQAPVVILHEAPVQDHLQLACGERVPAPRALAGASRPAWPLCHHRAWKCSCGAGGSQRTPRDSRTRAPCAQPSAPPSPAQGSPSSVADPCPRPSPTAPAHRCRGWRPPGPGLCAASGGSACPGCRPWWAWGRSWPAAGASAGTCGAGSAEGQRSVAGGGSRGARAASPHGQLLSLPRDTWKPLRSVKKVSSLSMSVLKRRASSLLMWSRMSTRQDMSRDRPSTPVGRQ